MASKKKELAAEVRRLKSLLHARQIRDNERLDRVYEEFQVALRSVTTSEERRVRVIMPNGAIVPALCARIDIEHEQLGGGPETIPGLMSVTMTLHPEPRDVQ